MSLPAKAAASQKPEQAQHDEAFPSAFSLRFFYVALFLGTGVSVPFFPAYLRSLGLSGREVSTVLSASPFLHLSAPLVWGWAADRTRRPATVLRIACLGAVLGYVPLMFVRSFPAVLAAQVAHQSFYVAIAGLSDSLALARVRHTGEEYGRARVWGSLAFIIAGVTMGQLLSFRRVAGGDVVVPMWVTCALSLALIAAQTMQGRTNTARPAARDVRELLSDRRFLVLLAFAAIHWACTAPYHGFLTILLQDRGLSAAVAGRAFGIGVVGEMLALYFFRQIRQRLSLSTLLMIVAAVSAARWLAVSLVISPVLLVGLQTAHALTFGLFWGAALAWLTACVPVHLRATGQTLFTAATFGLGYIAGTLSAGTLYDLAGGAQTAFRAAAVVELVPLAVMAVWGRRLDPGRTGTPT